MIIKNAISKPIKNILFVSDFTDDSKDSYYTLTHFADAIEANVDLLFVNIPNQTVDSAETVQKIETAMAHFNGEDSWTRNVINASSVEDGIERFIADNPTDLIAICTHGKSGFQQLFSPSIAEKIANHTALPLLSIKL